MLAGGCQAIVATDTGPRNAAMIKLGRKPGAGAMTKIAGFRGDHVIEFLTGSGNSIVTVQATSLDLHMIDPGYRGPEIGAVAVLANIAGLDMINRRCGGHNEGAPLVAG